MAMPPDDHPRRVPPSSGGDDPDVARAMGPTGADRSEDATVIGGAGAVGGSSSAGDEPTWVGTGPAQSRDPATTAMPAAGPADRLPPGRPPGRTPPGGGATWLWALGILVVVGVLAAILLTNQDDDDDVVTETTTTAPVEEAPAGDDTTTTVEETTTTAEEPEEATTTTTEAPSEPGGAGTLETSDGRTLLPVPEDQDLSGFAGADVEGENVPVQSVVEDQGVWLGTDEENRVFALVTPEIAVEDLAAGDRVHLTGVVEPNEEGSPDLGSGEGSELLERQGHHIAVSAIEVT